MLRMKIEFQECFVEFIKSGVGELEKTFTMKMFAMDWCAQQMLHL